MGRGSGGRVGADGHGADVPEGVGLSWRSMVQEASDPRPAGLDNRGEPLLPRAPRHPRLMRKPWGWKAVGPPVRPLPLKKSRGKCRRVPSSFFLEG